MKINKDIEVAKNPVEMEGANGVSIQILIGTKEGSENIIMRKFTLEVGGHTPYHTHDFEHVVRVVSGEGHLVDSNGKNLDLKEGSSAFVAPGELHQFKNASETRPFEFLCIIPNS
jgi:quercetin dioxygenase-like cupin family protein